MIFRRVRSTSDRRCSRQHWPAPEVREEKRFIWDTLYAAEVTGEPETSCICKYFTASETHARYTCTVFSRDSSQNALWKTFVWSKLAEEGWVPAVCSVVGSEDANQTLDLFLIPFNSMENWCRSSFCNIMFGRICFFFSFFYSLFVSKNRPG